MRITTGTPQFQTFFEGTVRIHNDHCAEKNYKPDDFSFTEGKRYIKVIHRSSVHSFVDMDNGDVLKPASWKAPAKHARGNIFDEFNGLKNMGPWGPAYLR